ncbi:thioesterase II family protein [Ruminococcus flavefaciens]|jgi:surfactin synthase thioesterase subunit|uniref:thioesterase II family protein n=1 Tax=Ruminococcus flavefaciens TaxID=1265 RepID=UPI00055FA509|nr:thioesterase domain-containing protein [Ruminococcus flavefaciens]
MMNLFCIPCAGGSAYMFRKIGEMLPPDIKLCPLEIPGRGSRFNEELESDLSSVANDLYESIKDRLDEDYCILGFSMGGILAYELCCRLMSHHRKMPGSVFILGSEPPEHFSNTEYHKLDDESFKKKLISINGIPRELIDNSELFDFYIPVLRADFTMCETYKNEHDAVRFDVSFHLINGISDDINRKQLDLWRNYCRSCTMDFVPGDHFFINTNIYETATAITKNL